MKQYRAVFRSGRALHRPHSQRRNTRWPAATSSLPARSGTQSKTAMAMRLDVPVNILSLADELIE